MPGESARDLIERKLAEGLSPLHLEIVDESRHHAGHSGARSGAGHFAVTVVSAAFTGLDTLARHRLVYRILAEEMRTTIHALALATLSPEEWSSAPGGTSGVSTLR